jgi:hypothetical protein
MGKFPENPAQFPMPGPGDFKIIGYFVVVSNLLREIHHIIVVGKE